MNKQQEYLLGLLKEIDQICRRNGIDYVLVGGSLIGALRNKGFLPWDDDADIAMTYENYKRFREACATQLPPNRVLSAPELREDCPVVLPRYTSTENTLIHTAQSLHSCPAGTVVDIFILDPVADGTDAQRAYEEKLSMLHEMCNYASTAANRYRVPFEAYEHYAALKEREGKLAVCRRLCAEIESLHDAHGSRYLYRWQGVIDSYPRNWFDTTIEVEFEGCRFLAPAGFNSYLTFYFGEEWAEIPRTITATKHDTAYSLNFSAEEAVELYHPPFNPDELRSKLWEDKAPCLALSREENCLNDGIARARAIAAALEFENHLQCVQPEFDAAYAAKDGRTLAGLLRDLINAQNSKELIGRRTYTSNYRFRNPVLIPVPDKAFEAMLWALMETRRMYVAQRFLNIREQQGADLTPAMAEVKQALKVFRSSVECLESGEFDKALTTATIICKRHPHVAEFLKLVCVILTRMCAAHPSAELREQLRQAVAHGRACYPGDGYFAMLEADALWEASAYEEARALYLRAAESTRNGFALTHIAERTGYWPRWMRKASWGRDYGLPSWEDEEPKPLPAPPAPAAPDAAQPALVCLYETLKRAAQLCDELNVPYYLSAEAQSALMNHGLIPDAISDYAIVVGKGGARKLVKALKRGDAPGYLLEIAEPESDNAFYICKQGTLRLDLSGAKPAIPQRLAVAVHIQRAGTERTAQRGKLRSLYSNIKDSLGPRGGLARDPEPMESKVDGFCFKVLKKRVARFEKPEKFLAPSWDTIVSTSVDIEQLREAGALPQELLNRCAAVRPKAAQARQSSRVHRDAFVQLKLAVALKELAPQLLAQKDELLALDAAGDEKALRKALAPYLRIARAADESVNLNIDPELYELMQKLL